MKLSETNKKLNFLHYKGISVENAEDMNRLCKEHGYNQKNGCAGLFLLLIISSVIGFLSCRTIEKQPNYLPCTSELSPNDTFEFHEKLMYIPRDIAGNFMFDSYKTLEKGSYRLYLLKDSDNYEVYVQKSEVQFLCTEQQSTFPRENCYPYESGMAAVVKYNSLKNRLQESSIAFEKQVKYIEDTLR